ncbi:hypothetical protein EMIT0373P_70285 [Pseudomonas chlororaphis]
MPPVQRGLRPLPHSGRTGELLEIEEKKLSLVEIRLFRAVHSQPPSQTRRIAPLHLQHSKCYSL